MLAVSWCYGPNLQTASSVSWVSRFCSFLSLIIIPFVYPLPAEGYLGCFEAWWPKLFWPLWHVFWSRWGSGRADRVITFGIPKGLTWRLMRGLALCYLQPHCKALYFLLSGTRVSPAEFWCSPAAKICQSNTHILPCPMNDTNLDPRSQRVQANQSKSGLQRLPWWSSDWDSVLPM